MIEIERLRGEIADEALELRLAATSRQFHPLDVVGEIEIRVVPPVDAGRRIFDLLAIAPVAHVPVGDLFLDLVERDRPLEDPDGDDHHRIGRPIHAEPGRIDRRHALAAAHFSLPRLFSTIARFGARKKPLAGI